MKPLEVALLPDYIEEKVRGNPVEHDPDRPAHLLGSESIDRRDGAGPALRGERRGVSGRPTPVEHAATDRRTHPRDQLPSHHRVVDP